MPSDNLIAELADEYDADAKVIIYGEGEYEDNLARSFEKKTKESSTFGLRGSSSNDEELEADNVDWQKMACEADQSAARWKKKMMETTGKAKEEAKKRYLEAKDAGERARAELTPKAKQAWEKTKEKTSSAAQKAKNWFKRHIRDESTHDREDEFDVQC